MNILIICPQFKPVPAVMGGAIETLVDEYLKYNSRRKKYQITVYSVPSNNCEEENNKYTNTVFRYINKNTKRYKFYKIIIALLRRFFYKKQIPTAYSLCVVRNLKKNKELGKYDLVIIENQVESLMFYRKFLKSKLVEHLHNDYINVHTKCAKKITNSCDEFWCVSNFISNQIKYVNVNSKTKILYNGVDSEKFNSKISENSKRDMYNKLGFDEEDYIILYVGRIMPEKGVLQLMKAYNNIKEKNDKLKLLIVGSKLNNSLEIQNYYKLLLNEKYKNNDSIILYGEARFEELKALYSISNLQVVPSMVEEAFGLIIVEGMCMNKPLIVSNSGGIPEIVGDSATIVERKNIITELEEAIKNNYDSKEMKKDYKDIVEKFSIKNYCENFERYIEKN